MSKETKVKCASCKKPKETREIGQIIQNKPICNDCLKKNYNFLH